MDLFAKDRSAEKLPLSILTGFLGSGKTTLLARLLRRPEMKNSAVVVNEIGAVGLDHHLLETVEGEVALLPSGCVCCTLRGDLDETLRRLLIRRQRMDIPEFDRVLIETTGLADPAPILQLALSSPLIAHYFRLDATVATVDAVHGARQLDEHPESVKQAALADVLVLTKTDLASAEAAAALDRRLAWLNPAAARHKAVMGEIEPDALFGAKGRTLADLSAWLGADAVAAHAHDHDHDHGHHAHDSETLDRDRRIRHFCLDFDEPLDWPVVAEWLAALRAGAGEGLLRVKGLLNVRGRATPVAIHGVHHIFHPPVALAAWPDEDRRSRIVFITRDLPRAVVEESWKGFARGYCS